MVTLDLMTGAEVWTAIHAWIKRRGLGVQTPLENHKVLVSLAILVQTPWKITKLLLEPAFNLGPSSHNLNGVSLVGHSCILFLFIEYWYLWIPRATIGPSLPLST